MPNTLEFIVLLHTAATLAMTGLIWFVQVVHYPLFAAVGARRFPQYEADHQRLTTRVVMPLMLTELASSAVLCFAAPQPVGRTLPALGMLAVILLWLLTFLIQVPQHRRLSRGYDGKTARELVRGNWGRTILWTARGWIALWIVARLIR